MAKPKPLKIPGLKHPIIQAPMFHYSGHRLVVAASRQGILGSLSNLPGPMLQNSLEIIQRELTVKQPFAVNIFLLPEALTRDQPALPMPVQQVLAKYRQKLGLDVNVNATQQDSYKESVEEQVELLIQHKAPVVIFTFGLPSKEMVHDLRQKGGCYLIASATTIEEAIAVQESGCDAVVLQGMEAGGHRTSISLPKSYGQIGLFSLLAKAKSHLSIPYIAAGGIVTHQAIQSCLQMGASACSLGSIFLLANECSTPVSHRHALANAWTDPAAQTVLSRCFTGRPARMLVNAFYNDMSQAVGGDESKIPWNFWARDIFGASAKSDKAESFVLWSGQSHAGKYLYLHLLLCVCLANNSP